MFKTLRRFQNSFHYQEKNCRPQPMNNFKNTKTKRLAKNWLRKILRILKRNLLVGSQCVNNPKILDLTKGDVFRFNLSQNDENIG